VPLERPRKPSSAPGIVAPPVEDVLLSQRQATAPIKLDHKAVQRSMVPPDKQHPPAPAYPVRDTPSWAKPDTHTPPPKPKLEPQPKTREKKGWFGWGAKKDVPQIEEPEPFRDRPKVEPFRAAAPGK
jgi:hypothetical protein